LANTTFLPLYPRESISVGTDGWVGLVTVWRFWRKKNILFPLAGL